MAEAFEAFVVTDPHLGNHLAHAVAGPNGVTDRLVDQLDGLEWALGEAERHALPLVCLGDLFDDHGVDTITLELLGKLLGRVLPKRGFFVVPGNHDAHDQSNRFYSPSALSRLTDGAIMVLDDINNPEYKESLPGHELVAALPFCSNAVAREFFAQRADKTRLLLAHLEVNGFGHGGAWACTGGLDDSELAPWGAVLTGHFHARQTFKSTLGMYPGALAQLKFDDCGKHQGGWVVQWDGEHLEMDFVPWPAAPTFKVSEVTAVGLNQDVQGFTKDNASSLFAPCTFLKLVVSGTAEELKAVWRDDVRALALAAGVRRVVFDDRMVVGGEKRRLDVEVGAPLEDLLKAYVNHPAVSTKAFDLDKLLDLGVKTLRAAQARRKQRPVAAADEGGG